MIWHFADVFETIAALVPDRPALVEGAKRRSWREFEDRAARLASALVAAGIAPDAKVAIFGHNSAEYLEAQFAIFKARGVPINVNYRYVEEELAYLFDNADVEAVFFDARFAPRFAAVRGRLPKLKTFIRIEDGSFEALEGALDYETLIAVNDRLPRLAYCEDDIYMLYTGGTTGMPKGVMYRHNDAARAFAAWCLGPEVEPTPALLLALVEQTAAEGAAPIVLPACPLMHGTGMWLGAFVPHFKGGAVALMRDEGFDPHRMWSYVAAERINVVVIVGDAFARPMLAALDEARARGAPYDLSSFTGVVSSGVMFSTEVKLGLLEHADIGISDGMGSTEGSMGISVVSRAEPPGETAHFAINPKARVFDENDEEVVPGSDRIGMIGSGGYIPVGYYKDSEKTAKTFRTIRGVRYSFPGDFARVAVDGTLILLGRGSACINTGGEKVFPEEVEEALKAHASVWDALVVGVPDERFGQRVIGVVSPCAGETIDEAALIGWARTRLAGYKMPRALVVVDQVQRAANGKADYKWAKDTALAATG